MAEAAGAETDTPAAEQMSMATVSVSVDGISGGLSSGFDGRGRSYSRRRRCCRRPRRRS